MQGRSEVLAALAAVWVRLQAGETGEAERELARAEELGAAKADVCLMRAHIAEAKGAFREALQLAYEGLAVLAGQGAADADAATHGVAADVGALSHSLERLAARVGEKSTGFTWEAVFASTGAANAASARYSMLMGQANAVPMPKEAKARLTKHFAFCTVTCDYALRNHEGASFFGRLTGRFRKKPVAAPAGDAFISQDGPAFEVTGPFCEDEWDACNA